MLIQQQNPLGEILGGLAGTAGAYLKGKQERKQRAEDQARQSKVDEQNQALIAAQIQSYTDKKAKSAADEAAATATAQQQKAIEGAVRSYLNDPKTLAFLHKNMTPEARQQAAYSVAAELTKLGASKDTIKEFMDMGSAFPRSYQQTTGGDVNKVRITLIQAQTEKIKSWREAKKIDFDNAMKKADAAHQAAAQRALAAAGNAMARTKYSADARQAIALQTAIIVAQGKTYDEAFSIAKMKYAAQLQQVNEQYKGQLKDDANTPAPAMPNFNINVTPGAPSVQPYVIQLPSGGTQTVNVPRRGNLKKTETPVAKDAAGQYLYLRNGKYVHKDGSPPALPKTEPKPQFNIFNPTTWFHHQ